MGRELSPLTPAAEAQTQPACVLHAASGSDPIRRLLERRLAQQRALAQFARRALRAPALDPLLAEGAALVRRLGAGPDASAPGADEEDRSFFEAVTDVVEAASDALRAAELSRQEALHDPLTGLANRSLIIDHLDIALARAARRSTLAAVVFLDLDDFKQINDTLGHAVGDELLVCIAERLRDTVRPADTLGRWGGDEFVAVCDDLEQAGDVPVIVERIARAFELPFHVHHTELSVVASIGVAVSGGTDDPATLMAAADSAMYQAKRDNEARRGDRPEAPALPAGVLPPKHERLTFASSSSSPAWAIVTAQRPWT
jgi:diguanylate cyclase (GGDEF)-like protein